MQKLLSTLVLCSFSLVLMASIKPALPYTQSGPNIAAETDNYASVTAVQINYLTQTVTLTYGYGNATISGSNTTAFTPGALATPVSVTFYLAAQPGIVANTWVSSTGLTGTMTGGEVTVITGDMTGTANATLNSGETFAINHNIFGSGSTSYPWNSGLIP